ncbi:MAG: VWA domain-containing protein [Acidimicrobiales bacterium]
MRSPPPRFECAEPTDNLVGDAGGGCARPGRRSGGATTVDTPAAPADPEAAAARAARRAARIAAGMEELSDPVDLLFATQLGGGTDVNRAVAYCQGLLTRPTETILIVLSDLFEGGDRDELVRRLGALVQAGVTVVALLALSDDGSPSYDHNLAQDLAGLGIVSFACTPDHFPDLMAAAIERRDLGRWAASQGIVAAALV